MTPVLGYLRRRPIRSHLRRRVRGFLVGSKVYKDRHRATLALLQLGDGGNPA